MVPPKAHEYAETQPSEEVLKEEGVPPAVRGDPFPAAGVRGHWHRAAVWQRLEGSAATPANPWYRRTKDTPALQHMAFCTITTVTPGETDWHSHQAARCGEGSTGQKVTSLQTT